MPVEDIRQLKRSLREKYRSLRLALTPEEKAERDRRVGEQVRRLWQYSGSDVLLSYVSTPIEVDTHDIIRQALAEGKRVAVPRCVPDTRRMEFYFIDGLEELQPGTFGVLEPEPNPDRLLPDCSAGLCLVPGFCYDRQGFRLGYGKGYYDRFLAQFDGYIAGICYSDCVCRRLPHGRFDRPAEVLVTDQFIRRIDRREIGREMGRRRHDK